MKKFWRAGWIAGVAACLLAGGRTAQAAGSPNVVISQVYGGGGATSGSPSYKNDYIELYNRGTSAVSLAGWSVQYASATGSFTNIHPLTTGSIPAGRYFFIKEGGGSVGGNFPATLTVDATGSLNLSATSGKVALVSSTTSIGTGGPTAAGVVDFVGYGTASLFEGSAAAPLLTNTTAALRAGSPRGTQDTDQNGADFTVGTPDPRGSEWPAAGPATQLAFSTNPSGAAAENVFTTQPTVTVEDANGQTSVSYTGPVTLAIKSGTGTAGAQLLGTATVNAVAGVANFSGLSIDLAGTGYVLSASASGLTGAESAAFTVAPPPTPTISFTTQPSGASAGLAFAGQPVVTAKDSAGNVDTGFNGPVSVAIMAGTGTSGAALTGTTTVNAVSGVATFTDLAIDTAGNGYVLTASASGYAPVDSGAFDVSLPATTLDFTTSPAGASAGNAFTTQPVVVARDDNGAIVTSFNGPVTLIIREGTGTAGAVLSGTSTVNAVNGTATFAGLSIDLAGAGYVLTASSGTLAAVDSEAFNVGGGTPASLSYMQQPGGGTAGSPFAIQPIVIVKDANGIQAGYNGPVSVSLNPADGTPGAVLGGGTTVNAVNGEADYVDLSVDRAGAGYVLTASIGGTTLRADSDPFNVTAPAGAQFSITDLGTLPGANTGTYAYAINNKGQVVGYSGHPFLWANGTMTDLAAGIANYPMSVFAVAPAKAVNDSGTVVGAYNKYVTVLNSVSAFTQKDAFRWTAGTLTDADVLGSAPQEAVGVNSTGDIAVSGAASYLEKADATTVAFNGLTLGSPLAPFGINDSDQVAGMATASDFSSHAVLWQNGNVTDIGTLPGDANSTGRAVNAFGQVVGDSYGPTSSATNTRAFLWENGAITALPSRTSGESCAADAINRYGQTVGYVGVDNLTGMETGALLWENGQVKDLQTLLPSGNDWILSAATGINDLGQIVGYGFHAGNLDAFLLNPTSLYGDANRDGIVTLQDAVITLGMVGGLTPAANLELLDVAPANSSAPRGFGDNRLDLRDVARIMRDINGLETPWP